MGSRHRGPKGLRRVRYGMAHSRSLARLDWWGRAPVSLKGLGRGGLHGAEPQRAVEALRCHGAYRHSERCALSVLSGRAYSDCDFARQRATRRQYTREGTTHHIVFPQFFRARARTPLSPASGITSSRHQRECERESRRRGDQDQDVCGLYVRQPIVQLDLRHVLFCTPGRGRDCRQPRARRRGRRGL